MRSAKHYLHAAVKRAAVAVDRVRPPHPGVVVLLYHRVGGRSGLEIDLSSWAFTRQCAQLQATGRVVTLAQALDQLASPASPASTAAPDPPIVLTFDDGTADFADRAVPVLARFGLPATLYAATAYIEESRPFADGARPCSWAALADARATGLVDVGSHTHRHRLLDRITAREVDEELDRSIGLIEERLGTRPSDFAYPKAVAGSEDADRAIRRRFRSAALAGTRANVIGRTDPYRLARSPIQTSDGLRWFTYKVAGGMGLEDDMRRVLNRARYLGAST